MYKKKVPVVVLLYRYAACYVFVPVILFGQGRKVVHSGQLELTRRDRKISRPPAAASHTINHSNNTVTYVTKRSSNLKKINKSIPEKRGNKGESEVCKKSSDLNILMLIHMNQKSINHSTRIREKENISRQVLGIWSEYLTARSHQLLSEVTALKNYWLLGGNGSPVVSQAGLLELS
jgi:phosphoribosyl-AMP cyclohydrolase